MIYPQNFEEKAGFDRIRALLLQECLSSLGEEWVKQISFLTNKETIGQLLSESEEFRLIISQGQSFPSQDYLDMRGVLGRLRIPGSYILPEEISELKISLEVINACLLFFGKPEAKGYVFLKKRAENIIVPKHILKEIDRILDEKGLIRDNASPQLAKTRKEINRKRGANERAIHHLLQLARLSGWVDPDAEITLREGRLVLPVHATYKRKIRGWVHDESATGQTVYLEPEECFEMNNDIRELENAERREIIKILTHFSDLIRPDLDELMKAYRFLGLMDFIRARARLAMRIGGIKPLLTDMPIIHWRQAKHPLLFLSHQLKGKEVVPLDLSLDETNRILIISGPNAGGKSVCLKTAGLLQYMLQCGLEVPMDSSSEAGIFQDIFIDIGDEQSLENDLSTYSSHLLNINYFIRHCNENSLFLIDEFGAGSDPSLGGAIAEAALERLNENRAFGIVTTHYSNLKLMAERLQGIINGAMLFDPKNMQPLYVLATGKPGSSFTFEIAEKIGFPKEIIRQAAAKTGKTHLDFEKQLQELEIEKQRLEKQQKEFEVADQFINELIEKYQNLSLDLEKSKKEILEKARIEALKLVEESNRAIENTIKQIREAQAEKTKTMAARKNLLELKEKLEKHENTETSKQVNKIAGTFNLSTTFKPGNWVKMEDREKAGYITRIQGKEAIVDFDGIRFTVSFDKLIHAEAPARSYRINKPAGSAIYDDLNIRAANFKLTLDVRGKTAEEAMALVQKYIDDAVLLSIRQVNILHGKGEGILRKVIRDMLAKSNEVESYSDEHLERGGAGITIINLK